LNTKYSLLRRKNPTGYTGSAFIGTIKCGEAVIAANIAAFGHRQMYPAIDFGAAIGAEARMNS